MAVQRRWVHRMRGDSGQAVIEFIVVGVLVLVPFTLGAASVGVIQSAQVHVDAAAAEASRAYAMSANDSAGVIAARTAAQVMVASQTGLGVPATTVTCLADCDSDTSRVRVSVQATVTLPLLGMVRTIRGDRVVTVGVLR